HVAGPEFRVSRAVRILGAVFLLLLCGILACATYLVAVIALSLNWYARGVWLSPVPMIVGMLVDTSIAAISRYRHALPSSHDRPWLRTLFSAPLMPVKLTIGLGSVWILVSHAIKSYR